MHILLDTHTILWTINDFEKLSPTAKLAIYDEGNTLYISIASAWEVAIKNSLGKLEGFTGGVARFNQQINLMPIVILNIKPRYLQALEHLPFHHRDPFDRMLIATAQCEGLTLLTADSHIGKYDISTLW